MTSRTQLIKARLGILALADAIKNVARACRLAGVSRSQFYSMRKAYETRGQDGLAPSTRRKPSMPNRTPPAIESRILWKTQQNPSLSYPKLATVLTTEGHPVTPTMVRYVWERNGLSRRSAREQWANRTDSSCGDERMKSERSSMDSVHAGRDSTTALVST